MTAAGNDADRPGTGPVPPREPTPETPAGDGTTAGTWSQRAARQVLRRAVRGRAERGNDWGEAMLAEFEQTRGGWESTRWALSGAPVSWWRRHRGDRTRLSRPELQAAKPRRRDVRIAVLTVLAAVVATAVLRSVLSVAYIPSGSMEPTLHIGDRYLVDRIGFRGDLHHGDLVLFNYGNDEWVKRVLGLPGDTIDCADGVVQRNGQPVAEPYLTEDSRTDCARVTVPAGSVYVLGDHREVSRDSRDVGPVGTDAVNGRVVTRVWPLAR